MKAAELRSWLGTKLAAVVVIGSCVTVGCQKQSPLAPPQLTRTNATQTFAVKGVIQDIVLASKTVNIKHEEIKDYMAAMTMPFHVRDTNEVMGLNPGDGVSFKLHVTDEASWIDDLRRIAVQEPPPSASRRPAVFVGRDVDRLSLGDPLPECRLTNELGQQVTLSQFKGQALAINFIFTRCPLPDFCPRLSGHFRATMQLMKEQHPHITNWRLLSVSIDPEFDSPPILKAYANGYHYDPQRWSFLTGDDREVDAICQAMGVLIARTDTFPSHNLRVAIVTPEGRVQQVLGDNTWKPDQLAAELVKAATTRAATPKPQ